MFKTNRLIAIILAFIILIKTNNIHCESLSSKSPIEKSEKNNECKPNRGKENQDTRYI